MPNKYHVNEEAATTGLMKYAWYLVEEEVVSSYIGEAAPSPSVIVKLLNDAVMLNQAPMEQLWAVYLNAKSQVVGIELISQGSLSGSNAHPREVFRGAILSNAGALVVAHNHPSGDTTPSKVDDGTACKLVEAGELLGIPVYDFIIVGDGTLYSYNQEGKLD